MYLTQFQLNPMRRESIRVLSSPQRMHAAVLGCFPPDRLDDAPGRVLWRVDEPTPHERNLFIVSPLRPSLEVLQERYGWSQEQSWRTADYDPLLGRLREGQGWRFRLTANPVRVIRVSETERGKVSPHLTIAQQIEWLVERAVRHGFTVPTQGGAGPTVRVTRRNRETFLKGSPSERVHPTITRVQFDGILEVSDPDRLRHSLVSGIGRAKAYGCGLLTLAPLT